MSNSMHILFTLNNLKERPDQTSYLLPTLQAPQIGGYYDENLRVHFTHTCNRLSLLLLQDRCVYAFGEE